MNNMFVEFVIFAVFASVLNAIVFIAEPNYLLSVLLVMGGLSAVLVATATGWPYVTSKDIKAWIGFCVFSNAMTVLVEYFMLKYDVWAFSKSYAELSGFVVLGAPIEEFVYWALCPVIVGGAYLNFLRQASPRLIEPALITKWVAKLKNLHVSANTAHSEVTYTETDANGQYRRGGVFPVYIYLQILIVTAIVVMFRYFRGSWKALGYTTALFLIVAFPHEYYSVGHGFWIYNVNHQLGWFFMRVPLEGWIMYVISPICGCMMLDVGSRVFFKSK
jgi:hypothetical protein